MRGKRSILDCILIRRFLSLSLHRIELLEEECLALKTRLDTVQQDKASDLTMYKRMLDQARKTFKDACR